MIRRTSQRAFRAVLDAAREAIPDVAIATDVIVGFPGETDAEFAISRDFIEEMEFADMHVFRYSARPGTAAARLPDQVSESVKHRRSEELHVINQVARQRYASEFVGASLAVLWEGISGATDRGFINAGYTSNFLRVQTIHPDVLTNQIHPARLREYNTERALFHGALS
jgi:threonylcarbamoyladenosine tRNA methylthiotransferase MtaB